MEKEIAEARVGSVEVVGGGERADPWLVFPQGISKNEDEHIFCNILEEDGNNKNKYFVKSIIPEMHATSCLASYSNGSSSWLVMMKDSDDDDDDDDSSSSSPSSSSCFLWNPVSSETIQLPPLQIKEDGSDDELLFCILSSPPTDPDCMVLVFLQSPTIIYCRPCVDEQWSKQDYEIGYGDRIVCAAFISNSIYAYTHQAKILAIDMSSTISSVSLSLRLLDVKPPEHPPEIQHTRIHLLESCGDLFLVCIIFVGLTDTPVINTIEVFKMDFSVMSWVKVKILGDCRAFFLSLYGSTSCAGGGRIKGNCIYFTLSQDNESLYVFHMEDGNVSVSMPCPDLMPPFSDPYWIMMPATTVNENKGGYEGRMNGTSNSVAPPPMQWTADMTKFTTTTTSTTTTTTRSPWLMFFAQDEEDTCFFLDPGSNKTYFMNLPELSGAKIRFSKDDWLLMTRGRHTVFFFNPFTKAKIDLPDMPLNYYFDGITFSSLPTSSDCMVFGIAQTLPEVVEICSYHVGQDESWNYLATECDEEKPFIISHSNPVFYNGAFHCLSREGRLGVFGVKDDGWNWTVLPNPQQCSCPSSHYSFLVECDGELLSVFVGHVGESVQVYKLDRSIMSWETVESLGDHMVFLSRTTSLARMTREEKMQNKIYFPRVWVNNNLAVFYSMKTRRYHSFSNHSTGDLYGTKEQVHCSWV